MRHKERKGLEYRQRLPTLFPVAIVVSLLNPLNTGGAISWAPSVLQMPAKRGCRPSRWCQE